MTSIFTLGSAVFLLISFQAIPADYSILSQLKISGYQLFSALPKNGEVLGATVTSIDGRKQALESFFRSYNSPLLGSEDAFIQVADKYNLPWTLLPAIAGKESGFGKVIPYGSYNAWGWGIFTGQKTGINFLSWEDGINGVGAGIRKNYFNKGMDTVASMEYSYTPPSANGTHSWKQGVEFFMQQIENWK